MSLTLSPSITRDWVSRRLRAPVDLAPDPGIVRFVHPTPHGADRLADLVIDSIDRCPR